jgi:cbb3-type cytochrome oxidase maturation protein
MSVLYLLFPLALLIAAGFVLAFSWASRRGQFDDLDTPAIRVLHDDDPPDPRAAKSAAPPGD